MSAPPVRCMVCRQPMTLIAPTQTTHPTCTPVEEVVDFAHFTQQDWEVWHVAFVCGYLDGAAVQQAEDFAPIEAAARASVRRTASSPDYATLCERRGNPARAQAVRDHWRATGLVGGPA